jgi:hypothetical protein
MVMMQVVVGTQTLGSLVDTVLYRNGSVIFGREMCPAAYGHGGFRRVVCKMLGLSAAAASRKRVAARRLACAAALFLVFVPVLMQA